MFLALLTNSCLNNSSLEDEFSRIVNTTLDLTMISSVSISGKEMPYLEMREKFKFISVVFLQEGCAPCYPKFVEWHRKMKSITQPDNYTTLFVINARSYQHFTDGSMGYEQIDDRYYHVIDPENRFLRNNSDIPRWIIDRTLLIDQENRIKLIGAPYATEDMTKVFHIITGTKE